MLHILYITFIYPLEAAMRLILERAYGITGDYGAALLLLSVAVNIVLLPLYHLAETWQEAERRIQNSIKPKAAHIKAAFSGEERYMMLRTLYRQNGYHPLYAVRVSFGLLIQVPFFFAAYHLLSHYTALQGVPFLIFGDLARPDGLLRVAGLTLNVMPLVMTMVNLASAHVYTRRLSAPEQRQLYGMAILFLVLLYTSPVALIYYWTLNNIFSLLKNIVYCRFKILEAMGGYSKRFEMPYIAKALSIYQAVVQKLDVMPFAAKWALTAVLLLCLLGYNLLPIRGKSTSQAIRFAILILAYLNAVSLADVIRRYRAGALYSFQPVAIIITAAVAMIIATDFVSGTYIMAHPHRLREYVVLSSLLLLAFSLLDIPRRKGGTLVISSLTVSAILFIYNPLTIYISSPERGGTLDFHTLAQLTALTLVCAMVLSGGIQLIGRLSRLYQTCVTTVTATVFLYSYIIIINYGLFRGDRFIDEPLLYKVARSAILPEIGLLAILWAILYKLTKSYPQALAVYFSLMLAVLHIKVSSGLHSTVNPEEVEAVEMAATGSFPKLFQLSAGGRNIILLVPDAAAGYLIPQILENDASLSDAYDGFTYYANTVAAGNFTMSNTAALIGGARYSPIEINKRPDKTLSETITNAYSWLVNTIAAAGYEITLYDPSFTTCDRLKMDGMTCSNIDTYARQLYSNYGYTIVGSFNKKMLLTFALFKALPLSMKPILYDSNYWKVSFRVEQVDPDRQSYDYLFIHSLPQMSSVAEHGKNRFIHVWSDTLIAPFYLDKDCRPPKRLNFDPYAMEARIANTGCFLNALSRWFDWMKSAGIYDNTKIVIASDHGSGEYGPIWNKYAVMPLLMVKDFNERGRLKTSDNLMYNADVPAIICSAFGGCPEAGVDTTKYTQNQRTLIYSVTKHGNIDFSRKSRKFEIDRYYEITGNVHDMTQWVERRP